MRRTFVFTSRPYQPVRLAELTAKIEEFRNSLLESNEGLSRPLARKVLTSLKSLLRQAK